ncbi:hypothetical protein ACAG24_029525, partial [Mycobacterium sp. pW049]|uniref:hypothetical protein n=1 Tax=[Mycobacterium] bulgaricum TaxID=3238985 RepID=UPI0035A9772B
GFEGVVVALWLGARIRAARFGLRIMLSGGLGGVVGLDRLGSVVVHWVVEFVVGDVVSGCGFFGPHRL